MYKKYLHIVLYEIFTKTFYEVNYIPQLRII